MEEIEQLRRQVRDLSLAVRLGVSVVIAAFTLHCTVVLTRAPQFGEIFGDLLDGAPLPILTQFFLSFAIPTAVGIVILALVAIAALFTLPRQVWTIPFGIFVAIATATISQLAAFSLQLPLLRIISSLSA